jgi:NTP pyrophosphatase (non-canonical NTP hydrolase)
MNTPDQQPQGAPAEATPTEEDFKLACTLGGISPDCLSAFIRENARKLYMRDAKLIAAHVARAVAMRGQAGLSINVMAKAAHLNSYDHGFWEIRDYLRKDPRWPEIEPLWRMSRIALMHSEASEAVEGIRKPQPDDHCPELPMEEAELADIVIRVGDYAAGHSIDLERAIKVKMAYNATRPHKHGKLC